MLCLSYSALIKAQDIAAGQSYTTGNLVLPTNQGGPSSWTNGVYQDSLTCWGWGNPGYCGPNAIVRPGNNINFSFGTTDLYQSQAIANVLPNTGTGLRVDGYNFGFTAKNGNGWDDGRVDTLSAYVHLTNQNNQVVEYKSYNLNYKFNWTTFNFSETFTTPYAAKDLGRVTYGFVGHDNNFWAGPYGPEIYNVSFSLKYSVDPCATNVLSSPSCPGYLSAISSYSTTTQTAEPATVQTTQTTIPPAEILQPVTPISTPLTATTPTVTPTQTTTSSSSTNPQQRTTEVATTTTQTVRIGPSISQILGIVGSEQSRVSRLEVSAVAAAIEQATQDASKSLVDAQSIASSQQAQTVASNQSLVTSVIAGPSQGVGLQINSSQMFGSSSLGLSASIQSQNTIGLNASTLISSTSTTREVDKFLSPSDPLSSFMNPPPTIAPPSIPSTATVVNRNVQPNEAAGGRDITAIAIAPPGFDSYTQLTLRDAAFYKPFSVYENQRTIDNRAAARMFGGSEQKHQQMVDDQYKNRTEK